VIDLPFASPLLFPFFRSWDTSLPSTGSDHIPITLTFAHPISSPAPPVPNWSLTNWDTLSPALSELLIPPPPSLLTKASLEAWFDTQLARVTTLLSSHTPLKRPSHRSKPWWSPILSVLRREFHSAFRRSHSSASPSDKAAARLSKQGYFKAIKAAKKAHWKSLLASATHRSIWAVKRIAAGSPAPRFPNLPGALSPKEMNQALLDHCFPPRPALPSLRSSSPSVTVLSSLKRICPCPSSSVRPPRPLDLIVSPIWFGNQFIASPLAFWYPSLLPSYISATTPPPSRKRMVLSSTNLASSPTTLPLPSGLLSFSRLSPRSWKG